MTPLTILVLAAVAAAIGMALGRSQEFLLRRAGGPMATTAVFEGGLERLRWVAPAVLASIALKAAVSPQPSAVFALLPLAVVGPWVLARRATGVGAPDWMLGTAAFFTANGVVVSVAFSGRPAALLTAPLSMALCAALALGAWKLSGEALPMVEVKVAALVGLALGALGWPAVGLALLWTLGMLAATALVGRVRAPRVAPALLAGAWVAAVAVL